MTGAAALLPLWLALGAAVAAPPAPPRFRRRRSRRRPAVRRLPRRRRSTRPIRRVETQQPEVVLTFDACATKKGWYGFDHDVFEILKREQVPATIFVSGLWVETHPEAMADLTGDPLIEFGDHSYDHPHMTTLSAARIDEEIDATEAALSRYGRHAVAFRPPFGDWNRKLVELVRAAAASDGHLGRGLGRPGHARDHRRHRSRRAGAGQGGVDHRVPHQRARLEDARGAARGSGGAAAARLQVRLPLRAAAERRRRGGARRARRPCPSRPRPFGP